MSLTIVALVAAAAWSEAKGVAAEGREVLIVSENELKLAAWTFPQKNNRARVRIKKITATFFTSYHYMNTIVLNVNPD